ncbi:MAG TPA: class I SAM-dependent methyltransferase [Kofleriaceae bacterium]
MSKDELGPYLASLQPPEHPVLAALRERTAAMPIVGVMQVSPTLAQLLQLLIRTAGARQVLEVGVFTGYSTLAMAMALPPEGKIIAMDVSASWTAIAREFWQRAGLEHCIDLRIGPATETLDELIAAGGAGGHDLAFLDANKDGYCDYFERCLTLLRPGGLLVADNTLFGGRVVPSFTEERIRGEVPIVPPSLQDLRVAYTEGARRFNAMVAKDERVDVVLLPALDGITLARKRAP